MRANPSVTACRPGVTVPDTLFSFPPPFPHRPRPGSLPTVLRDFPPPHGPPGSPDPGSPCRLSFSFHIQPEGRAWGLCMKDRFTTDRFSPLAALPCPSSHGLPFVDSRDVLTPLPAAPHPHHPDRLLSHLPGELCFNRGPSNFLA